MRFTGKTKLENCYAAENNLDLGMTDEDGKICYNGNYYEYDEDVITILFMGIDKINKVKKGLTHLDGGCADVLFLGIINTRTKTVKLLAINRDSMVDIDVLNIKGEVRYTKPLQITLAHGYGLGLEDSCLNQCDAVSRLLYGIPINAYVSLNMGGVAALNDAIGGVTLTSLDDIYIEDMEIDIAKDEEIHLTGKQAYFYVRFRDEAVYESARIRLERQKQYVEEYCRQLLSNSLKDLSNIVNVYNAVDDYTVMNLSTDELVYLASMLIGYEFDFENIYSLEGSTYSNPETYHEEFTVDEDSTKKLILDLFYRQID
ncbi:transcriptional attenuator, LytR family [Lachnospira pectinoschiza]|uniref:Transcriptional attenuator, LytR family n=1 Tax=Lachnospira pectinoschiza TaxID=28052 RepID=A0A1G9ZJI8_9FIRM|nr:transcriptional attenuator, LytR family [Lachnospira pectinoschiza]